MEYISRSKKTLKFSQNDPIAIEMTAGKTNLELVGKFIDYSNPSSEKYAEYLNLLFEKQWDLKESSCRLFIS